MATAALMTLDEFLALPEQKPYREFVRGEVFEKPLGTDRHSILQLFIGGLIVQFLMKVNLGQVGSEWRCIFGEGRQHRALVPDIMYVSWERRTPSRHQLAAPDFVIEILSPGQSVARLADKIQFYLRYGVRLLRIVDPDERIVTVLAPDADPEVLGIGDVITGRDVLPGYAVPIADLFAVLDAVPPA